MFPWEMRILIVDDSALSRNVVKAGLNDLGYDNIIEAGNGKLARAALEESIESNTPIEFMFTDLHMPEMGGIELVEWVRTKKEFNNLPIIVLTTSQDKNEVLAIAQLKVTHFMIKPCDVKLLKKRMESAWQRHKT